MSETFTIFVMFLGVIVVAGVVFVAWIGVALVRLIGRTIFGLFRDDPQEPLGSTFTCPRRGCQALNPVSARFCRRCGRELLHGPGMCRAAMW